MQAVILIGGKQYNVKEDDKILVNKIDKHLGTEIEISDVLMLKKNGETIFGTPTVKDAKVLLEVVKQTRGPKIIVFKMRPKKGYRKKIGHRQYLTELKVKNIIMK
ncbi:MAG: 50S ribosomal protein L21 [Endomicrobiia bacterium]